MQENSPDSDRPEEPLDLSWADVEGWSVEDHLRHQQTHDAKLRSLGINPRPTLDYFDREVTEEGSEVVTRQDYHATYTLTMRDADGDVLKVEITGEQVSQVREGRGFAYWPHDQRVALAERGRLFKRESAVPQRRFTITERCHRRSIPIRATSIAPQGRGRASRQSTNRRSPGSRRTSSSSRSASADPGDDSGSSEGDGQPAAARRHLHVVPDPAPRPARYSYACLTAAEHGAEVEAVGS